MLKAIENQLKTTNPRSLCRWIDAKGLLINNSSGDRQAGYGYAGGGMGKGYKLYAIADSSQGFIHWTIRPMNVNESKVARNLIEESEPCGYLVGDSAYDVNVLYDIAGSRSIKLVTAKRYKKSKGLGHRKHSPFRVEMRDRLGSKFIQSMLEKRVGIEHMFGLLCNLSFGLKPLLSWVRGLFRVENWVRAKLIFFSIWQQQFKEKQFDAISSLCRGVEQATPQSMLPSLKHNPNHPQAYA